MIEKLLANPFAGDGTLHPDLHLIFVDEVCGLFNLQVYPDMKLRRRFSLYLLGEKHSHGIGYVIILELGVGID